MGKDQAARIWTQQALTKLCASGRGAVSAGELAAYMGISRNTAKKRLEELHGLGLIERMARYKQNTTYYAYYCEDKSKKADKVKGSVKK